jgi:hypothetical protein
MIVHLESGLWQVRKEQIAELSGNSKDRWVAKGWNGRQEESEEEDARNDHWRGWIFVSREENGTGSWRAASGGRDGIQAQQGIPTDWAE